MSQRKKRIVIGVSGASGSALTVELLTQLRAVDIETHLVVSKTGDMTLGYETSLKPKDLRDLADFSYGIQDYAAQIASGSFPTDGMVIVPCSVKCLAEVATGVCTSLLTRAADVTLKERRRLIMMVRETPFSLAHIRNMEMVTQMGGVIFPPLPLYYANPKDLDQMNQQIIARMVDLFGIELPNAVRWSPDR